MVTTMTNAKSANEEIYGTWRLVGYTRKLVATGEQDEPLGKNPNGYITYSRDGRMVVLIVSGDRPKPASIDKMTDAERSDLFKTMVTYAGRFTFDGKTVIHHIDISANEVWTGTDQERNIKIDGNKLTITTNPQANGVDGKIGVTTLSWEKVQ